MLQIDVGLIKLIHASKIVSTYHVSIQIDAGLIKLIHA